MASTVCGNGHLYDPDLYVSCPYCNGGDKMISFEGPGKTMPLTGGFGAGQPVQTFIGKNPDQFICADPGLTVAKEMNLEPVVGWLVCIEGPEKGKDFRLVDKQNTVGRSEAMDVRITDMTVSRDGHARIAYDSRHNNFTLIPAETTNNIYVNNEPAYVPVKLKSFDCIEFGASKFIFVPFCCDRFTWQNGPRPANQG